MSEIKRLYPEDCQDIICPFCGEKDFDRWGLKLHLEAGHCDEYSKVHCPLSNKEAVK
jgi:hypothetical protein